MRRSIRALAGLSILVVLTGDIVLLLRDPIPTERIPKQPPISHPQSWDERIQNLVAFVEKERALAFENPVTVEFLNPEEYKKVVTTEESTLTDREKKELETFTAVFRSMGLIGAETDLLKATNELVDEGTLAFYDHETKKVMVRGSEMTVGLRVTLVHELTHVLQDQHFDLTRLNKIENDGAANAFRAVVEGDATRIEDRYVESLDESEKAAYDEESQRQAEGADLSGVPTSLISFFSSPYVLGGLLVRLILRAKGEGGINDATRTPPTSEEHLMDPFTFLEGNPPAKVATPKVAKGETKVEDGDFGALAWFVVLAGRIDVLAALKAVDGWGGDSYLAYQSDERTCVRAVFKGDTPNDTEEMGAALDSWAAAMPAGVASVARIKETVEVRACDPGAEARVPPPADVDPLILPVARGQIALEFMEAGVEAEVARCIGQRVIESFSLAQLADPEGAAFRTRASQRRLAQFVQTCQQAA